jgi:hypothetical protein
MVHWLDGIRQLNLGFWRVWLHHPLICTKLALLTIAVGVRDFFLWLCMGEHYMDDED